MTGRLAVAADQYFARNLKVLREASSMSQQELAEKLSERGFKFHAATVYKLETGTRHILLGEAMAIAFILKTSLDALTQPEPHVRILSQLRRAIGQAQDCYIDATSAIQLFETAVAHMRGVIDNADAAHAKQATGLLTVAEMDIANRLSALMFVEQNS